MDLELAGNYDIFLFEGRLRDGSVVWTAVHPDLHGCNATGRAQEDAVAGLAKSRKAWLMLNEQLNEEPPEPNAHPAISIIYLVQPTAVRSAPGSQVESSLQTA